MAEFQCVSALASIVAWYAFLEFFSSMNIVCSSVMREEAYNRWKFSFVVHLFCLQCKFGGSTSGFDSTTLIHMCHRSTHLLYLILNSTLSYWEAPQNLGSQTSKIWSIVSFAQKCIKIRFQVGLFWQFFHGISIISTAAIQLLVSEIYFENEQIF